MIPCMGGNCIKRDKCANYYAEGVPVERLCGIEEEPEPITKNDRKRLETGPMNLLGGLQ